MAGGGHAPRAKVKIRVVRCGDGLRDRASEGGFGGVVVCGEIAEVRVSLGEGLASEKLGKDKKVLLTTKPGH
jgi:hypothetical protein